MQSKKIKLHSFSSRETVKLGYDIAKQIAATKSSFLKQNGALVVALIGDLGAGKTTFVRGFSRGLGIRRRPTSPTFVLMRRYGIRGRRFSNLYHVDAYRIKNPDALHALGLKEIFADPKNIVLVEWPERAKKILPKKMMRLTFRHGKKENERVIISR